MTVNRKVIWLVVGDGAVAQYYTVHAIPVRLTKVPDGTFKASPKTTSGPEHNPETLHTAHLAVGHGDHQRHENVFVEHVADKLQVAAQAGSFDEIIVVLPPKALAHFRKVVAPVVKACTKKEISGDWTHLAMPDLERHVAAELF